MREILGLIDNTSLPHNLPTDGIEAMLGYNCCYIVSAVILRHPNQFNCCEDFLGWSKQEVLLIQEAKTSCRGQWYLPAGRLEKNETLAEGAQREVEEEAGFKFQPTSIICVEGPSPGWVRVNFSGEIVGGELKSTADSESLQAQWFEIADVLNVRIKLRATDILHVITKAVKQQHTSRWIMPMLVSRSNFTVTLIIAAPASNSADVSVVLTEDGSLPSTALLIRGMGFNDIVSGMKNDMGFKSEDCLFCCIVNLAHDGRQGKDGVHTTIAYTTTTKISLKRGWVWERMGDIGAKIMSHLYSDNVMSNDELR